MVVRHSLTKLEVVLNLFSDENLTSLLIFELINAVLHDSSSLLSIISFDFCE